MKLVENSNLPNIQTAQGLYAYADYLEHRLVEAQNLQRHANIVAEQNNKLYRKIFLLERKLALLEKEHNIKALLKDRHKLIKARLRIREAKKYNDQAVDHTAYWLFIAGVSWAINNLEEDNSVRLDNRAEEIKNIVNKIRKK